MYTLSPVILLNYRQPSTISQHKLHLNNLKKATKNIESLISTNKNIIKLTGKNQLVIDLITAIDSFLKHGILSPDLTYWKFLTEYLTRGEVLDLKYEYGTKCNHQTLCRAWLKSSLETKFLPIHLKSFFSGEKTLNVKYYSDKAAFFNEEIQEMLVEKLKQFEGKVEFLLTETNDEETVDIIETTTKDVKQEEEVISTASSDDQIIEGSDLSTKDKDVDRSPLLYNSLTIEKNLTKAKKYKLKMMRNDVINGDLSEILKDTNIDELSSNEILKEDPVAVHLKIIEEIKKEEEGNIFEDTFDPNPVEILTNDEILERERLRLADPKGFQQLMKKKRLNEVKPSSVPPRNFTENCLNKMKQRKNSLDEKKENVSEKSINAFQTFKLTRNRKHSGSFIIDTLRNFSFNEMLGKSPTTSLNDVFLEPTKRLGSPKTNLFDLPSDDSNKDGSSSSDNDKNKENYGEIFQEPGDIMYLLGEVFQDTREKFYSMFGIYFNHTIEEPVFQYLCITNVNIYLLSKMAEGVADACEALCEDGNSIDDCDEIDHINFKGDKHEVTSYITHMIVPLKDIDVISVSYDYQTLILESVRGSYFVKNDEKSSVKNEIRTLCIDVGCKLMGQNLLRKINEACETYTKETKSYKLPFININENPRKVKHINFLKNELKDEKLQINHYFLIYWKHNNSPPIHDNNFKMKLWYREENTSTWKIVSNNIYKPWKEAYSELTYNQCVGFMDEEGKNALFSVIICEHVKKIVEESEDNGMFIITIEPKEKCNKVKFQLGFENYNDMYKWMNYMKEFLQESEYKEFKRPLPTQLFVTDKHMIVTNEHTLFNEKGYMRLYFKKEIDSNTKMMFHCTDERHALIIFDGENGHDCLFFRDEEELERVVCIIGNVFKINIPHLLELKESDKVSYFKLIQLFDEWNNIWNERFRVGCKC